MDLREADTADAGRLRELAESAMTASYALSPQELDAIAEERFAEERLTEAFDDEDCVVLVAEDTVGEGSDEDAETTIAGLVEGSLDGDEGELRWLFVDPERRGRGIGTGLFEAATDALRDRGAEHVRATTFEANTEGSQFFEGFGFEQVDQREVEIGEQSFIEHVYGKSAGGGDERTDHDDEPVADEDLPGVDAGESRVTATTDDGRDVYLDREDEASGTEGPLIPTYEDDSSAEQFGYYCGNCGSLDVTADEMERIECTDCANTHAERSEDAYDDSYI